MTEADSRVPRFAWQDDAPTAGLTVLGWFARSRRALPHAHVMLDYWVSTDVEAVQKQKWGIKW